MKKGKLKMLFAAMLAGVFLLSGCGAAEENDDDKGNDPRVPPGASNLILMVSSPISDFLYNRNDPELVYSVTEGLDNQPVEVSRLGLIIHDIVDGVRTNSVTVTNLTSGATLPTVGDGLHQLQFVVTDQSGAPIVTVFINYATDITDPIIDTTGFITNESAPLLSYTIDDPCFATNSCNEQVFIDGVETQARNGDPLPGLDLDGNPLPELTDGPHELKITFQDAAGNTTTVIATIIIDTTNPEIEVSQIVTNDPTPVLNFSVSNEACLTADPPTCQVKVFLDDHLEENFQSGDSLPALDDGTHTVKIELTDEAGNETIKIITFVIDATEPQVDVIGGDDPNAPTPDPSQPPVEGGISISAAQGTLTFTSDEQGDAQVFLDGTLVDNFPVEADVQNSVVLLTLSVGEHEVTIIVTDALGNEATLKFTFTVTDTGHPIVTIVKPGQGELLHPAAASADDFPVTLEFTVSDDISAPGEITVEVTLEQWTFDGNDWGLASSMVVDIGGFDVSVTDQTGTYTKAEHTLPDGDGHYRLVVQATDAAGNVTLHPSDESIPIQLFHVDTTAPVVEIISPMGPVTGNEPVFKVMATEQSVYGLEVFLCKEEQAGAGCDFDDPALGVELEDTLGPLEDGSYLLLAIIKDAALFTGSDQVRFSINAVAPVVIILNPDDGDVIGRGSINLKYSVRDASDIEIYLKGPGDPVPGELIITRVINPVEPIPRTYKNDVDLPLDGEYTITVRVFDRFGNFGTAEDTVTFIADSGMPSVDIVTPNEDDRNFRSGQDVPLTFTFSDNTKEIVITLDGQVLVNPGVQPINLGPFSQPDGAVTIHTLTVTVSNTKGSISDSVDFIIDDSAPVVTLLNPSDGSTTTSTTISLSYTVNDPNNSDEGTSEEIVTLDGAPIVQRSGDNISVAVGGHTISVQVVDLAGNPSNVAGATFTIIAGESDGLTSRSRKSSCFINEQNTLGELVLCQSSD